uniref:protein acetyllysine N-acetyltransferase n=1 Tax=Chlamydomonas reinhardtii TaxID=3055 RepID=D9I2J2_CHLRE|nr:SIR2-like protein [Chlamydomonas reinhardtii]
MSLGYADRLKPKKNLGGQLGAQEFHQDLDDIKKGVKELAGWKAHMAPLLLQVRDAKRVFVFTGAGISTACGIPDFRGPNGIWTLRKKGEALPTDFTPFEYARPSFTHMAISGLVAAGKCPYVCSQNVDSLHLWSGVPRSRIAELHGNCFAERCRGCGAEYARDFQMETVDFRPSGRRCTAPGCGGELVDNILDWDTPLPQDELDEAVRQAEEADVALVLGTSLQIQPANEIPVLTRDEGGKLVIVNLQKTPKDRRANLLLRARVDLAMALLARELGMQVGRGRACYRKCRRTSARRRWWWNTRRRRRRWRRPPGKAAFAA